MAQGKLESKIISSKVISSKVVSNEVSPHWRPRASPIEPLGLLAVFKLGHLGKIKSIAFYIGLVCSPFGR